MSGFNTVIKLDDIGNKPKNIKILANDKEKNIIAKDFGLVSIKEFTVDICVKRLGRANKFEVKGNFVANVVHNCVVTLEDFEKEYKNDFRVIFEQKNIRKKQEKEDVFDIDVDDVEYFEGESIDIAQVSLEYLSLNLDDFPRKNGVEFNEIIEGKSEEKTRNNPFDVLKNIK